MKSAVTLALLLAAAAAGASQLHATPVAQPFTPPRQLVYFGHVKSVTPQGKGFLVRVDPAQYLSGQTANRAAIEDGVIPPGDVVPNDHYVRDEGHRLLTYSMAATGHVTVLTYRGGIRQTPISVAELGQIVKGRNPRKRRLFEPKNGFWIRVASARALALDQQYLP
jgi:hypothetical protein